MRHETFQTWRHVVATWLFRLAFWVLNVENPSVKINGHRYFGPGL